MPKCSSKTKTGRKCQRSVKNSGDVCPTHKNTCSICMEIIESGMNTLPCKHQFHEKCINKWKDEGKNTCPCCRTKFKETQYSAFVMLYPRVGTGEMATVAIPDELIGGFLRSLNINNNEIDRNGDNINLEFSDNNDLREYFEEIGVSIDNVLRNIT